jgi:hypothetical protein
MISGFDHVVILASEIEAATAAYRTLFARAPSWRHGGDGAKRALFTLDNMTVELRPMARAPAAIWSATCSRRRARALPVSAFAPTISRRCIAGSTG